MVMAHRNTKTPEVSDMNTLELCEELSRLRDEIPRLKDIWLRSHDAHATHVYAEALDRYDAVAKRIAEVCRVTHGRPVE